MPHILVIDDDPVVRLMLSRALQNQGYSVALANDGRAGIVQAREIPPDLIICDWMMPHLNGLEVCRQIKADPQLATTFLIMLTTLDAVEDRIKGLDAGADEFLSKPVEINELQARVRAGLRLRQLTQNLQQQKQTLETEFLEAAAYVRSLLPVPLTGKVTVDSRFIPSRQLGGDSFDYFWLDPDYFVLYLLDVSGHGLGAALPSVTILNMLRSQSLPDVNFYQPQDVLRVLNETFQMDQHNDKYFTIWYGVYNRLKRQLIYASAGHPPAVLLDSDGGCDHSVQQLKTTGMPIGMVPDASFTSERKDIPPGSTLYIFSDGVFDVSQSTPQPWGFDEFVRCLTHPQTGGDLDRVLEYIREVNQFETFEDDVSLLKVTFPDS